MSKQYVYIDEVARDVSRFGILTKGTVITVTDKEHLYIQKNGSDLLVPFEESGIETGSLDEDKAIDSDFEDAEDTQDTEDSEDVETAQSLFETLMGLKKSELQKLASDEYGVNSMGTKAVLANRIVNVVFPNG